MSNCRRTCAAVFWCASCFGVQLGYICVQTRKSRWLKRNRSKAIMLDLCKICTLQTIIFFGISVQLGWSILPSTCNFMLRNCGTHTDCWQQCAINPDTKSTAMCLVEIFLLYKPNGRGQVSIGLVRKQFLIKKTTKALLRDCRSCKEKAVANGNMWMQNTQERAETLGTTTSDTRCVGEWCRHLSTVSSQTCTH